MMRKLISIDSPITAAPTLDYRIPSLTSTTMPLRGKDHRFVSEEFPYFTSLEALDKWADATFTVLPLSGVVPYKPRSVVDKDGAEQQGKLLVNSGLHPNYISR